MTTTKQHVQYEDQQLLGGAIVIEHRYIQDIVDGTQAAGLNVR